MHVKSLRRIVLMVVAMVASSLSLVAVSTAPANAAAYSSFSELENNYSSVRYGVAVTLTGRVGYDTAAPKYVNAGTATLQRLVYGSSSWANVSSKTYTDTTTDLVWSLKPSNTTQYRIVYSGGTYGADTYGTSVSNVVKVGVKRNLGDNFNRSTRVFYGKVTPSYARRTVYIQKSTCSSPTSSSCTWSLYKTLTTTSTGTWSTKLPAYSRRTHFRGLVKASNGYIGGYSNYYVTTYSY